jgi:hypothetical protein
MARHGCHPDGPSTSATSLLSATATKRDVVSSSHGYANYASARDGYGMGEYQSNGGISDSHKHDGDIINVCFISTFTLSTAPDRWNPSSIFASTALVWHATAALSAGSADICIEWSSYAATSDDGPPRCKSTHVDAGRIRRSGSVARIDGYDW